MKKVLGICFLLCFIWGTEVAYAKDVTLTWIAPTTNADGTVLTDLSGFRIYLNDKAILDIAKDALTSIVTVAPGVNCFKATAFDTSSNESAFSNIVCDDSMAPSTFDLRIKIQ